MELVLNLKPEEELQIRREADSSGLELSDYALQRLLGKKKRVSVRGKYARILGGSEEFAGRKTETQTTEANPVSNDPTIALLESWLKEDATDDPEELRVAEEELLEFKRNMNLPRKEAGARLHYPEAE